VLEILWLGERPHRFLDGAIACVSVPKIHYAGRRLSNSLTGHHLETKLIGPIARKVIGRLA
jgi:hypothetical protein